jgi:hypothetical protein
LKQGDDISPRLFNCALEYAIRRVQVNHGTHEFLVYATNIIIMGGTVHTIKKNAEALVVASKENGLEVNADDYASIS